MTWSIGSTSSFQFNFFSRQNVQSATLALQKAGQEVATGLKADIYEDLGSRAASVMRLQASEADTQTYMQANDLLGNKLQAMLTSIDATRGQIQSVLNTALSNLSRPQSDAAVLQKDAMAALESLIATLNTSFNGDHLFSGLRSEVPPLTRWNEKNTGTGLSPAEALASIFGAGPVDAADAASIADQIDAAFNSVDTVNPDRNFEATFYGGSPAQNAAGEPTKQVNAWVNTGQEVVYGARANDDAFREAIKGLAMLAVTDLSKMDEGAYAIWMDRVVTSLSAGQEGLLEISARVGFNQQVVETTQTQLTDLSLVRRSQISDYISVDPYEAVTRMQSLETQLQASYQVSAQLSGMSILNFLR